MAYDKNWSDRLGAVMNKVRYSVLPLLLLSSWVIAQGLPGKDLEPVSREQIQPLISICESCHGKGGQTMRVDIPPIAGKTAPFILSTLEQFYYYERHCPDVEYQGEDGRLAKRSMCDVTNSLSQPEAMALGLYFEAQQPAASTDE